MNLVKSVVQYMRKEGNVRVLPYMDDYLISASVGQVSKEEDCVRVSEWRDKLLGELGLERNGIKGVWVQDPTGGTILG